MRWIKKKETTGKPIRQRKEEDRNRNNHTITETEQRMNSEAYLK